MKLPLTKKDFPKTLNIIKHLPVRDADAFINRYSLNGLQVLNPKNNKMTTLVKNSVDSAQIPAIEAVKEFDDRLTTPDAIQIIYHSDSALVDNNYHHHLDDYANNHFSLKNPIAKYVDKDSLISDLFKKHELRGFRMKSKGFVIINIYQPAGFHFTSQQLEDILIAYHNSDDKFLKKVMTYRNKQLLREDGNLFTRRVSSILPVLMSRPKEYRRVVKHQRLLYDVSTCFHI